MKVRILCILLLLASTSHAEEYYVFTVAQMNALHSYNINGLSRRNFFPLKPPYWEPSEEDVAAMFNSLKNYSGTQFLRKFNTYKYQIFGYTEEGKSLVFINAFCSESHYWKEKWVFVFDGGNCFWQIQWDKNSKSFTGFNVQSR